MRKVQIPEDLFFEILRYHLLDDESVLPNIKQGLEEKVEAMSRRELYTKYKTSPDEKEREQARKKYLDKVGMHRDFRW